MCIWDKNTSSLQACQSKTWDFWPKEIYNRHGNLCKLGMFTILQDWNHHTKKVKFYLHQLLFRKHPFPKTPMVQKWKVQIFLQIPKNSNLTNRCKVTDWAAEVSQKTWGDNRGKGNWQSLSWSRILEKYSVRVVMSLVSGAQVMIGTVQVQWPHTYVPSLTSRIGGPHGGRGSRSSFHQSHREPKSVGCEVPISTSKSSADLIRSHLQ